MGRTHHYIESIGPESRLSENHFPVWLAQGNGRAHRDVICAAQLCILDELPLSLL